MCGWKYAMYIVTVLQDMPAGYQELINLMDVTRSFQSQSERYSDCWEIQIMTDWNKMHDLINEFCVRTCISVFDEKNVDLSFPSLRDLLPMLLFWCTCVSKMFFPSHMVFFFTWFMDEDPVFLSGALAAVWQSMGNDACWFSADTNPASIHGFYELFNLYQSSSGFFGISPHAHIWPLVGLFP